MAVFPVDFDYSTRDPLVIPYVVALPWSVRRTNCELRYIVRSVDILIANPQICELLLELRAGERTPPDVGNSPVAIHQYAARD